MKLSIDNLIAAPFTPMNSDESVNVNVIPDYAQCLLDQGVTKVYILGTTGEGMSLSVNERMEVAEAWKKFGKMDVIMNHIGANSIADVKALAAHSEKIGLDAIALLAPFYYKCVDLDALIDYLAEVSAAAPNTPLVYYHFAGKTGVNFDVTSLIEKAMARVPTFAGVKFTGWDLGTAIEANRQFGDQVMIGYGKDEQVMASYFMGLKCSVGSTYNWAGKVWNEAVTALKSGDNAGSAKKQEFMTQVLRVIFQFGFNDAVNKSMMKYVHGVDMGPVRRPISQVPIEKLAQIHAELEKLKFRQCCLKLRLLIVFPGKRRFNQYCLVKCFFSPLHKNNITLDELIGCGTYGKVYSGKMKGDPVAIKIIDTRKAPQKFVDKFLPRELELAKRVDHVNLQRIVLDFKTRREHYIITDLAQFDLLQYMKAKGALRESLARRLFLELITGINYLHNNGIVHRDIKCENLLIDCNGFLKVADFGFARSITDTDLSSTFCGSTVYTAPEILSGANAYNPRLSDIWSCGVVLFIMLTGGLPFSRRQLKLSIVHHTITVEPPSKLNNKLTQMPDLVVSRILVYDPDMRPSLSDTMSYKWFTTSLTNQIDK